MADDWKSYVDLDGTHVHVAANSPTTVAELLEQRGVHRAQIVQTADGTDHHLIAELIGEAWQLADFTARHQLVPRLAELQARLDAVAKTCDAAEIAVMIGAAENPARWETAQAAITDVRAALQGNQPEVPGD